MNITTHTLSDELPPRPQKKKKRSIPRHITERRKEVLHWMAKGKDNLEIAQILGINFYTAKTTCATFCGFTTRPTAYVRSCERLLGAMFGWTTL